MIDLKKASIIFLIAILYGLLINALVDTVYPQPNYDNYCKQDICQKNFDEAYRNMIYIIP